MNKPSEKELCPVCGYALGFEAWQGDLPSDEICPCCGMQFGYYDSASTLVARSHLQEQWRKRWIECGMRWDDERTKPPANWNPKNQLRGIGVLV